MKKKWVVRVVLDTELDKRGMPSDALLECFRYAGVLVVHKNAERVVFDIPAPAGISDTKLWADMNSERMQSFGFNAAAAPQWKPTDGEVKS